jgi:hypothetical protein
LYQCWLKLQRIFGGGKLSGGTRLDRERQRQYMLDLLARLRSDQAADRRIACDSLNDFFVSPVGWTPHEFEEETREAMEALLKLAARDEDKSVLSEALRALSAGSTYADGARLVNWHPLIARLDELGPGDLEAVIVSLAFAGEQKYRAVIAKYVDDPREEVRMCARDQLEEIDVQINVEAGRRAFAAGLDEASALQQARDHVPVFQASSVLVGYYVPRRDMGNRNARPWRTYRTAVARLSLSDPFNATAKKH